MQRQRGSGSIYLQKGSSVFWVKYYRNGKPFRESTHTTEEKAAAQFLKKRLAEITTGSFYGPRAERIKVQELAEDFLRDYRINGRKSLDDAEAHWKLHLEPFFGHLRAVEVSSDLISRYVDTRQLKGAKNATINRELAALKRMFRLGLQATPPKVIRVPAFPKLAERNVRKGFVEDTHYQKLAEASAGAGLWMRALFETGYTYGWRISELLNLRVKQVDLSSRTIRLNPGETKNEDGRVTRMTRTVHQLLH